MNSPGSTSSAVLSLASLAVCGLSALLNAWIFLVLRRIRVNNGVSIYNLMLIRHLLITDAVTAALVVVDLSFKWDLERSQRIIRLPSLPANLQPTNSSSLQLPMLPPLVIANATTPLASPQPQGFCLSYLAQESLRWSHSLTLFALTLIALDLYMFISRAASYRTTFVVRYARRLVATSWTAATLMAALPVAYHCYLALLLTRNDDKNSTAEDSELTVVRRICRQELTVGLGAGFCCVGRNAVNFNSLQLVLGVFSGSCACVTFCYGRIVYNIFRVMRLNQSDRALSLQRHNRRGVLTALIILLAFYALFLPFFVAQFTTNVRMSLSDGAADSGLFESLLGGMMEHERADSYLELLMVAYTLLNPLLYACRLSAVRRHSTRTLVGLKLRTRVSARQLSLRLLGNRGDASARRINDLAAAPAVSPAVSYHRADCGCGCESMERLRDSVSDLPGCTFPASVSLAPQLMMMQPRFVQLPTTFP